MQAQTVVSLRQYQDEGHTRLSQGVVTGAEAEGLFTVDHATRARQAFSCLITPEPGDTVLTARPESAKEAFILAILSRPQPRQARLALPENEALCLHGKRLSLLGQESVDIASLGELSLSAVLGVLSLTSRNIFQTASESLIQNARNHIGRVHNFAMTAKQLLRLHGRQQIITADQDVRIDGERINMG